MGYFTEEQLEEIKQYILDTGTKDTDLPSVSNVSSTDEIVIVQNGYNKKINLRTLFSSFGGITKDLETVEKDTKDTLIYVQDIETSMITNKNLGTEIINNLTIQEGNWVADNTIIGQATGDAGADGADGKTWKPTVSTDGNLSWELNNNIELPEIINIKGTKGDKGDKGDRGLGVSFYDHTLGTIGSSVTIDVLDKGYNIRFFEISRNFTLILKNICIGDSGTIYIQNINEGVSFTLKCSDLNNNLYSIGIEEDNVPGQVVTPSNNFNIMEKGRYKYTCKSGTIKNTQTCFDSAIFIEFDPEECAQ